MRTTHFGWKTVPEEQKASLVRDVFDSVAPQYDLMNDLMSFGLHRVWKALTVLVSQVQEGDSVLDVAGGTGDLSLAFARKVGQRGLVVHTDINETMIHRGRDRLIDAGVLLPIVVCDAEKLPFSSNGFNLVSVAFGLRNMTHQDIALVEMCRVLKPCGKLLVLEFSKIAKPLEKFYDWYSFNVLPILGRWVAADADSYVYLAESIRVHPDRETLKRMMQQCGFGRVDCYAMMQGLVALHIGVKC